MSKNIAYLRVSTADQDLEKNKAEILFLANDKSLGKVDFVEEKISGKIHWRKRKIGEIIEHLQKGIVELLLDDQKEQEKVNLMLTNWK